MITQAELARLFAPSGRLRASINLGNPLLAGRDADGRLQGISVDLAAALAERLGLELELLAFDAAAASVAALKEDRADLGFFAIDPLRGEGLHFTKPYFLIEGCYLVASESTIAANEEVDREGHRVVVGRGSAYDLFLTRNLRHAALVRVATSAEVVPAFAIGGYEVAAGVRQQLEADRLRVLDGAGRPWLHLLDGHFMVIEQALAVPASRGELAFAALDGFLAEAKASGLIAASMVRHGSTGGTLAP